VITGDPATTGPQPAAAAGTSVALTVMLPVRNEERYIYGTLAQLHDQTLSPSVYEVIVADGESTDGTRAEIARFVADHPQFPVRVFANSRRLSSAGRNIAVNNGRGEYFLLFDGHVHIPDQRLLDLALALAHAYGALCLGRPQPLDPPDASAFQQAVALARRSPLAHSGESHIYSDFDGWVSPISVGVMYHRSVFERAGLFDESFDAAEDLEFNYRLEKAGIRCYLSPALTVTYYPHESLRALFRQLSRYGYGRSLFLGKHPERFRIEVAVPALFVVSVAAFATAALFSSVAGVMLAALAVVYGGLVLLEGTRLAGPGARGKSVQLALIIATVHSGLGVGFLRGGLRIHRGSGVAGP
jgi:succinoglycan biosynthesis protein ExoA